MSQIVKAHLTGSRMATLATAKRLLEDSGITVGTTTVWRLAHTGEISFKRTAFKGEVVLSDRIIEKRFVFGTMVDQMSDDELVFFRRDWF